MEARIEQNDVLFLNGLLEVEILVGKVIINSKELLYMLPSFHVLILKISEYKLLLLLLFGFDRLSFAEARQFYATSFDFLFCSDFILSCLSDCS